MTDLSIKSCLVVGCGCEAEFAAALSRDFGKLYYHTPFNTINPHYLDYSYGEGLEKVEKVWNERRTALKSDMVATFDIGWGDVISDYRRQGKATFGSTVESDVLECERDKFREIQKTLKLPTPDYEVVTGMTALRKKIKEGDIIKHNFFRGDEESIRAFKPDLHDTLLDEWATNLGPKKEEYRFIIEKPIKADIESGFDAFHGVDDYLFPYLRGYEVEHAYIGKWEMEPPEPIATSMRKLAPLLKKLGYRGLISDEEKIISPKKSIIIDMTMRAPSPLGLIFTEAVTNFSEVVWKIAHDEKVELKTKGKYVGCLCLKSFATLHNWMRLVIDEHDRQWIKVDAGCKYGKNYWAPRGQDIVADLIAIGNSVPEVIGKIKKLSERVNYIDKEVNMTPFQEILKQIKEGNRMGLTF